MGVIIGFAPVVVFVLGPTVFHGLNVGFDLFVFVINFPWVVAAVVFVATAVAANESSVSLLEYF